MYNIKKLTDKTIRPATKSDVEKGRINRKLIENIFFIDIDRPEKMNALSNGLVAQLRDAFIRFKNSDDHCAVLTSSGDKAFSVGADIKDPPTDPDLW